MKYSFFTKMVLGLGMMLFSVFSLVAQTTGFNTTYAVLSLNGGANTYYDLQAATGNPDFNGASLGTFTSGNSITIKGAEHNVYKCGSCDIWQTTFYYRVYKAGATPPSFTAMSIGYSSGGANGCGGQDQQWSNVTGTTNILSSLTSYGCYTLEVYSNLDYQFCGTGQEFANNSGNNYKATFTYNAPLNGTYSVGAGECFPTVASAVTALNANGVSGPVTFNVAAGHTETAPTGGFSITATGTVTNTITFQKSGAGANPTFTAPTPQASGNLNDAIFKIIGGDYITIDGFTMQENGANTTTTAGTNNMTEWGVALLYASTTNGAQNCTIKNCTIDLNRTYQNTFGIYSNSTHTATAVTSSATATTTAGGNSGLKIYGNSITDINIGIVVVGPTAAADFNTGIDIGGSSAMQGNTITNLGTTGTFSGYANVSGTVNGILVRNSTGFNISYNSITSSSGGTTSGTLNGIQIQAASNTPTGTFTNNITNNTLSLQSGLATGAINGINYPSGSASTTSVVNINNNNFTQLNHSVAASGAIIAIAISSTNLTTSISDNTFTNLSCNTTGSFTFLSHSYSIPASGSQTISNNSIVTAFNKTGAGGTVTISATNGSSPNGTTHTFTNNNFSNITVTGATGITGVNNTDGSSSSPTKTCTGNTFNNWTGGTSSITGISYTYIGATTSSISNNTITNITGQSSITGINIGSTFNGATTLNISSNTINNITSTGTGGSVTGISCSNTSTTININNNGINTLSSTGASAVSGITVTGATTTNVFKNKIYDLSGSNASSTVNGILVSAGTTVNVYNNIVGDLRTPAANAANPLIGISITGGTTVNTYYNTVYLNGSSSGALFGSSAISASSTPTVNLRNNIFVNNSTPSGSGITATYRRSTTTLTSYAATSNNNLFYAGTPGTNRLIFYDGSNSDQTLVAFKTRVGPTRDAASVTENPTFLSTTGSSSNFLHIDATVGTQIESGAATIATYTDDFDGDTRNVSTPDIGADEGAFTPVTPTIVLSANDIPAGNISQGINNNPIYSFAIGVTVANANLTDVDITTTGTYALADVTNLKVWYQATASPFNSGTATLLSTYTNAGGAGAINFSPFTSQSIAAGSTGYIFITADIPCGATLGNTIAVNAVTTGNTFFSAGTPTGSTSAGNTQTIIGVTNNVTGAAASTLSMSSAVSWTAPAGCYNEVLIVARAGSANDGTPSGDGSAYTGNLTFGSGTALGSGFVVYKGSSSPQTVTGLTNGTTYYFKIFTRNGTNWSSGVEVNATPALVYCTASCSICGTGDIITNVVLTNSNSANYTNNTGSTPSSGYYGIFNNTPLDLVKGTSTNTLAITFGTDATQYSAAWIDFNQNGVYESTDTIGLATSSSGSGATRTYTFTVPASATNGITRMRVRGGSDSAYSAGGACTSTSYGETEDYLVNIIAAASPDITSLGSASGCVGTSITINGTNLGGATAANVTIGGTAVSSITSNDGSVLVAVIASGFIGTGTVSVTTPGGTDTYSSFTVYALPATVSVTGGGVICGATTTLNASNGSDGTIYFQGTTSNGTSTATPSTSEVITTSGTYYFRALSADGCWGTQGSAVVTITPPVTLPQTVNFTSFTGSNLTTVFPNWYEATGATVPSGTTSGWTSSTAISGSGTTAKINLYTTTRNEWIVGPKFTAASGTTLTYKIAITDFAASTADASGMQGTDDRVIVRISTNCGVSFSDLLTYNAANTVSISNTLVSQSIDLSAYAGQEVILAFFATDGPLDDSPDYDFHIDDINISTIPPCTGAIGGTATGSTSFCTSGTPTITASGYSTGVVSTYQWMSSTNSGDYPTGGSVVGGQTDPATLTTGVVNTTTYFWLKVTCNTGTATDYSNMITVTINTVPTSVPSSNSPICAGTNLVLTGGTDIGTTFSWTGPNSFSSSSQNPTISAATTAAAGTYTLVVSTGSCTATATTVVQVNAAPTGVSATASASPVCTGTSIDLTSSATAPTATLLSETFNSGTGTFTATNTSTGGTPADAAWTNRANGYLYSSTTFSGSTGNFVLSNSDDQGSGGTTRTTLQSPVMSTVGFSTLSLAFSHYFSEYTSGVDSALVEVSSNGSTWTKVQTYVSTQGTASTFATPTINLNSYTGLSTFYVRFRYYGVWAYFWAVDNVSITGTAANTFAWTSDPSGFTSTLQNPTGVVPSATTTYTVAVSANSCTSTSSVNVTVNSPVVPTTPATYTSATINHTDGAVNNYADACSVLARITDAAGGNVLGNTTVTSVLSASVPSPNAGGYIYGRRSYTINATSTGPATLKLYFTQADFDDYNTNNGTFLDLPANPSDPNKQYFRIARVSGGNYTISGPLGDFLTWNSTDSRWEVDYAVADVNAEYYFVTMPSCTGVNVTGLQATNVQGSSLVATWDNLVTFPTNGWYSLQYKPVSSGTWIDAGTANGGATSKLIIGLLPGTAYEIQIRRHCSSQSEGPWSSSVFFNTPNPPCSSPPVLTMTMITANSATMTWPVIAGAGWFEFRYGLSASGPWTSAGTSGGSTTSKVITGLSPGTTYYAEARTFCASNGQPSEWGSTSFITPTATGCALPPVLTASTINATNVTVTWPAVGGAGWYEFRYKLTSSGTWISGGTLTGGAVLKLFGGLTASSEYNIEARTFCASNSQPSAWGGITVTTAGLAGCELPPSLIASTINATNITVTWAAVSGAAWYEFRYKLTSSGTWISAGTLGPVANSKLFNGLTVNTSYDLQARTFCSNGQPSAWGGITVSTASAAVGCQLAPVLSAGTINFTNVTVTWPTIGGAGWFEFRYSTGPTGPWSSGGTVTGTATAKLINGLSPATTYYIQARTFCSSNGLASDWSSNLQVMTLGAALAGQPVEEIIAATLEIAADEGDQSSEEPLMEMENMESEVLPIQTIGALTLYPNPTQDNLNVVFYPETVSRSTVMVLDITGRILQQIEVETTEGLNAININLGDLPDGMYIIQLRENGRLTQIGKSQKLN